ncbi:polysaccharide biosynthesis/export family protein [Fuscibacter oryzae]|uniref:Polysaccharide biosynthesis/export family protein n=1 Tax=Fuscibacter oryzae TaxID=2803939 RepID=A0A8J7MT07_9RHOB|nr:polysaccharide biosynthesis/export family protein [Fuscibacter oryzae]MBL4930087.1 polysaccharide biosynthesis/export family protein [Fuscibacter oryzae]
MTKLFYRLAAFLSVAFALMAHPVSAQDAGYLLRPGDVLQVEVVEDPSLDRSTLVLPNGSITFPQAGTLRAGGQTPDQVRAALTAALAPSFASPPTVYISVASVGAAAAPAVGGGVAADPATMSVYVMGEVGAPGQKKVEPDTNLLQFLAQAGALSKFAADKRIELHRKNAKTGADEVWLFSMKQVGGGTGRISGMTQLADGDVIVVPQRKLFE